MIKMTEEELSALLSTRATAGTLAGYYNENYKVHYNGKPYILRIPIPNAVSMDMRFIAEDEALAFMARHCGLRVPVVEMKETYSGQDYFLHSFIHGETVEDVYPESCTLPDWIVKKIAEAMVAIHKIPIVALGGFIAKMPWKLETGDFYDHIYSYNRSLIEKYNEGYRDIYDLFGMPKDIDTFIPNKAQEVEPAAFALAHSDIHRKNIIIDKAAEEATVIDWELALVATTFYDISIHFHKMRYQLRQEERFLDLYCGALDISKDSASRQIRLYRDIEEVKSVAIDVVRYLSIINEIPDEQIISNAKRYHSKLRRAYACWGMDPDAVLEEGVCRFFMERR